MALLIVGTVRLPPERLALAKSVMVADDRGEPRRGRLHPLAYAEDVAEPGLIRVSELWRDRDALARHFASPHLAAWRAAWPRLGTSDRNLALY